MSTAAILTIGTEITDGQIIDSNSQWISQQLQTFGIKTILHLSVPDEREDMLSAFQYARGKADLVFTCGGLGPTSDDFTRDIVAEMLGLELILDEPSWISIQAKVASRGVTLRDGHKRQALIPKGSVALANDYGVAPGFYIVAGSNQMWFLPGPPKEIAAIWNAHIASRLIKEEAEYVLHTWLCQGVPESELAFMTEEFFLPLGFKKKFGYRLQWPCVEVKLWYEAGSETAQKAITEFTARIERHLVKN